MDYTLIIIFFIFFTALSVFLKSKVKKKGRYKSKKEFYCEQEQRVMVGGYYKQPLLNKTEKSAFSAINTVIRDTPYLLFVQVSLGEILKHNNYQLYKDIMSKRVDFLITNADFEPLIAIEVHGSGHYNSKTTTKRDEIKKIALENANVTYLPIATNSNKAYEDVHSVFYKAFKENVTT